MHSRVCVAVSIQYGNKAERPEPPVLQFHLIRD
jgi:hypothetical protein